MTVTDLPVIEESMVFENTDEDNDSVHVSCVCSPRLSFCGIFMSELIPYEGEDEENVCKDCLELAENDCPRCGE